MAELSMVYVKLNATYFDVDECNDGDPTGMDEPEPADPVGI